MKPKIKLLFILIFFCSTIMSQDFKSEFRTVNIEFINKINGYSVKAIWKPTKISHEHIVGPAIIEFYNSTNNTSFDISNNNFSIKKSSLPLNNLENESQIVNLNKELVTLFYDENNLKFDEGFGTTNEPFFFIDIDFDMKKELVLSEVDNGQRGYTTYKIYKIENGDLRPELYNITYKEPYISFDDMSKIDFEKKTITIYKSGGACFNSYEIYKLQIHKDDYGDNLLLLETIIDQERDDNLQKCFELTYKVVNQTKQLISKREIKD